MTAAGESRCTCGLGFVQVNPPRCPHCLNQDAEIARLTDALKVATDSIRDGPHTHLCDVHDGLPCDCWKSIALSTIHALGGEK